MTKTVQPCSWETVIHVTDHKDNMNPLLALSNNLKDLYENMNSLNYTIKRYVIQTKRLEQIFSAIKAHES